MATNTKAQLKKARDLIREKRYREARSILKRIDHPIAEDWLAKVERRIQAEAPAASATSKKTASREVISSGTPAVQDVQASSQLPSIIIAAIAGIILGVIAGGLLFITSKEYYYICGSVALVGFATGFILSQLIRFLHIRQVSAALSIALLMGISGYVTYRIAEYVDFRQEFVNQIYLMAVEEGGYASVETARQDIPANDVETLLDEFLIEDYGQEGFIGFTLMSAEEGITITNKGRYGRANTESTLSGNMLFAYWILEILIMVGIPMNIASNQSKNPYCEREGKWLKMKKAGVVASNDLEVFLQSLKMGDYGHARRYVQPKAKGTMTTVTVGRCSEQSANAFLKVTQQQGRNTKTLVDGAISGAAYEALTGVKML